MKILINCSGNIGGGGRQVAVSFINECKKFNDNQYCVVVGNAIQPEIQTNLFPSNFSFIYTGSTKFYKLHSVLSKIERQTTPDVVFTVFGPSYWRPDAPHLEGYAISHYITPESEYFKVISLKERLLWKLKKFLHVRFFKWECDALVAETESVMVRASKVFGKKKYYTVSNTCNSYFYSQDKDCAKMLPKPQFGEFRLLILSKYYRHKNIELIPKIIDLLKQRGIDKVKFVLTIDDENYFRLFGDKYKNDVITLGALPIWDCPQLYKECDVMFLPTMLECFSASYAEAMLMERPILTSHYDFAKTVCKDAAVYFDPLDLSSVIEAIERLYLDEKLRGELVQNGKKIIQTLPSAQQRAEMYLGICKDLLGTR